jgi:ribosomal protein S21
MIKVVSKDGHESFESMYRRFRKKCTDERILAEFRERTYFLKPSAKRRLYEKEKQKRIKKANAKKDSAERDFQ